MSNRNNSAEPSMEQILESISDIIADNGEDGQQALPPHNELMPVSHVPVSLGNAPFDNILQAQPVSADSVNGSLTDRLANMEQPLEMRPVPEAGTQTPPNFMGQPVISNDYIEPVPVNMPVPQMTPHQPALSNGGFPVESAEDFLANNAQPALQQPMQQPQQMSAPVPQPEFSVNPEPVLQQPEVQQIVQQPLIQQAEIQQTPIEQPAIQQSPVQQAPVQQASIQQPSIQQSSVQQPVEVMPVPMSDAPLAPPVMTQEAVAVETPIETAVMQPNEVTANLPDTALPSASHDVLNSFKQAEEQAIASSEMTSGIVPEAGLLDASYIPASNSAALVAEPVGLQSPMPVLGTEIDQNAVSLDSASLEAAASAVVAEEMVVQPDAVVETQAAAQTVGETMRETTKETTGQQPIDSGFEGAVREMMKPMVKEWLDANLSKLVEDVVRTELTAALTKK